jgi:hypothetical protein
MSTVQILLLGGASGTGKTSVGWEASAVLEAQGVPHCVIDGDTLGHVFPAPEGDPQRSGIVERNLAAVWSGFAELGHTRLVYTNTVSVLEADMVTRAVLGSASSTAVDITPVVLTAEPGTVAARLARRETGDLVDLHVERSRRAALLLAERAPTGTARVCTDGISAADVALEVLDAAGW